MELKLPESSTAEGRLVLDRGPLAGQVYRVEPKVCGNPVCECKHLTLHCFPETASAAGDADAPLTLELDLEQKCLSEPNRTEPGPALALAQAVMDEITDPQWGYLWTFYFTLKTFYTEHANLDELDTRFPPNANEGGMVGYYEILPFAQPIRFSAEDHQWAFDDQYCVRSGCSCRAAVLQCFRIAPQAGGAEQGPNLSIRYHYRTQHFENIETSGTHLSPTAFLQALRKTQPDFDAFLARRHSQLRHLYRLFLKRHPSSAEPADYDDAREPVRAADKPGRNDPCPCGSGKKYKKCCGK